MQQTEVFDKAKWHFGADDFPPQLDAYQGYIHTGYYIGWLAKKGFLNMEEMPDLQHSIDLLEKNSISPVAIYREMMDGVFSSEDIIPQILSFTREYFDFDRGDYLRDYEVALGAGLPSLYYVKDTTENFEKIFLVIEESYNGWLRDKFFSGRWVGQFVYGDEYPEDIRGTVVPFVIEFIVKDGLVKGKCTDLENDVLQRSWHMANASGMKIIVTDHSPQWAAAFEQLKKIYQQHLGHLVRDIQHVGSTSVPGLPAKPILDIDIIIDDEDTLPEIIRILAGIGYEYVGDLGIKDRYAFKSPPDPAMPHHLYVCIAGSDSLMCLRRSLCRIRRNNRIYTMLPNPIRTHLPQATPF